VLAIPSTWALLASSGALNAPPRILRASSGIVAGLTLFAPWFAEPDMPLLRAVCAAGSVLALFRNLDVYRDPRPWRVSQRILHLVALIDTRRVRLVEPRVDWASLGRAALFGVVSALAVGYMLVLGKPSSVAGYSLRWLAGAFFTYCSLEAFTALLTAGCRLFGAGLPRLHADPILAATLSEFWGKRWNLIVHQLLRDHCFRPLAARFGVTAAVFGTFCVSGLAHAWLVVAGSGFKLALSMGSFFLVQGALVLLEQRLVVRRWWRPLQHVWTVTMVLLPAPLLEEPLLTLLLGP